MVGAANHTRYAWLAPPAPSLYQPPSVTPRNTLPPVPHVSPLAVPSPSPIFSPSPGLIQPPIGAPPPYALGLPPTALPPDTAALPPVAEPPLARAFWPEGCVLARCFQACAHGSNLVCQPARVPGSCSILPTRAACRLLPSWLQRGPSPRRSPPAWLSECCRVLVPAFFCPGEQPMCAAAANRAELPLCCTAACRCACHACVLAVNTAAAGLVLVCCQLLPPTSLTPGSPTPHHPPRLPCYTAAGPPAACLWPAPCALSVALSSAFNTQPAARIPLPAGPHAACLWPTACAAWTSALCSTPACGCGWSATQTCTCPNPSA